MAKISHSDAAPNEQVHYTFAAGEFDLGGRKKVFETDDPSLISEAYAHPALTVEEVAVEGSAPLYSEQISAADDPLSAQNSIANDSDAVAKAQAEVGGVDFEVVALDVGKDQTEKVETGGVAETLASDPTSKTNKKGAN